VRGVRYVACELAVKERWRMKIVLTAAVAVALLATATASPIIARADNEGPGWNIAGQWLCRDQCRPGLRGKPTQVVQNGAQFVFVNEAGTRMPAEWKFEYQISFVGCDDAAILSPDLMTLTFIDGSVWVR
jgi:hypothetical protein